MPKFRNSIAKFVALSGWSQKVKEFSNFEFNLVIGKALNITEVIFIKKIIFP